MPLKSGIRFSTPVSGLSAWICLHGLGVQPGAAVGQVVAGDAGDGGVAQLHLLHALGDPARLVAVERLGLAGVDLAEVAAPGALVAADEERRLAVLPALEDVGAARLLADRVQALGLHEVLQLAVLRAHRGAGLDPLRLALDRGLARCAPRGGAACDRPGRGSRARSILAGWGLGSHASLYAGAEPPQSAELRHRMAVSDPGSLLVTVVGGLPQAAGQGTSRRRNATAETSSVRTSSTPRYVAPSSRLIVIRWSHDAAWLGRHTTLWS